MLALVLLLMACGAGDARPQRPPPPRDAGPLVPRVRRVDAGPPRVPDAGPPRDAVPAVRPHLALGATHSCALIGRGQVVCWGGNEFGQLGDATLARGRRAQRIAPAPVTGIEDAVHIASGSFHTCALREPGTVACWGHGAYGQIGETAGEDRAEAGDVAGVSDAVELAAGEAHTCARLATRRVVCWGQNQHGQLGDGTRDDRAPPAPVTGLEGAIAIAAGRFHTCAVRAGGEVICWGFALDGQLGGGRVAPTEANVTEPRVVEGVSGAVAVAAGSAHTCARLRDGTVQCWGGNDGGQLGRGSGGEFDSSGAPAPMTGIADATGLALGAHFTCVLRSTGEIACAGASFHGEIGDGTRSTRRAAVPVRELTEAIDLASGVRHSCAIRRGGEILCWGSAWRAQLGDGQTRDRLAPVPVRGLMAPGG